jgi:hypothetical protein
MRETINLQPLRTTLSNNFCVSLTSPYSISSHSFTLYATSFNTTLPSSTIVPPYFISSHSFTLFATFFNTTIPSSTSSNPHHHNSLFFKNITTLLFIISFTIFHFSSFIHSFCYILQHYITFFNKFKPPSSQLLLPFLPSL